MDAREETKRKVLTRFLFLTESDDCMLADLADGTGVPVGVARAFVEDFGMTIASGVEVCWTQQQKEDVEAYLYLAPLASPAAASTTVNNYGPAQVHTGHGDQTMSITYGHALEALKTEIEKSDAIPPTDKKGMLATIDSISRHPLLNTLLQTGMRILSGQ